MDLPFWTTKTIFTATRKLNIHLFSSLSRQVSVSFFLLSHFLSLSAHTPPPLLLLLLLCPHPCTPTWFISSQAVVAMATVQEGGSTEGHRGPFLNLRLSGWEGEGTWGFAATNPERRERGRCQELSVNFNKTMTTSLTHRAKVRIKNNLVVAKSKTEGTYRAQTFKCPLIYCLSKCGVRRGR